MSITYFRDYSGGVGDADDDYDNSGYCVHDQDVIEDPTTIQLRGGDFGDFAEIEQQAAGESVRLGIKRPEFRPATEGEVQVLNLLVRYLRVRLPEWSVLLFLKDPEWWTNCIAIGRRWTVNLHGTTKWELWYDTNSMAGDIVWGGESLGLREAAEEIADLIRVETGEPMPATPSAIGEWIEEGF